jgi:hypothetical protein
MQQRLLNASNHFMQSFWGSEDLHDINGSHVEPLLQLLLRRLINEHFCAVYTSPSGNLL